MAQYKTIKRVYAHFRKRQYDDVILPQIILQGNYLQIAGFSVGDKVDVWVSDDQITIRRGGAG